MTQPYPFIHAADTSHAKASAATRLRSSRLRGDVAQLRQFSRIQSCCTEREAERNLSGRNCYCFVKIDLGIMQCTPLRISTTCETRQSPTIEVSE
jgi:hypothetical protein